MTSLFSSGRIEATFAEIIEFVHEQEAINNVRTQGKWCCDTDPITDQAFYKEGRHSYEAFMWLENGTEEDAAFITAASEHYGPMLKLIEAQQKQIADLLLVVKAFSASRDRMSPVSLYLPPSSFIAPPNSVPPYTQPNTWQPINTAASNPPPPLAFTFNNINGTADQIPPLTGIVGTATGDE